jgi:very-short-patch-repair endonuclease
MTDKEYLELRNGTAQRFNPLPNGVLDYRRAEEILAYNGIFRPGVKPDRTKPLPSLQSPSRPLSSGMSNLERAMHNILENADVPPFEQQYEPFKHLKRNHKIDFAFVPQKIALEVNGGVHAIKSKMSKDFEKAYLLQREGWFYLPVSAEDVKDGTALTRLRDVLEIRKGTT